MRKLLNTGWLFYGTVYFLLFFAFFSALIFLEQFLIATGLLFVFLALLFYAIYYFEAGQTKELNRYRSTLKFRVKSAGNFMLTGFPVGALLYDRAGVIEWHNYLVKKMLGDGKVTGKIIWELLPELKNFLTEGASDRLKVAERFYRVYHHASERLLYFLDETREEELEREVENNRLVLGFINLDNLDEAEHGLSDHEEGRIATKIYNAILDWGATYKMSIKKLDADRLLLLTKNEVLKKLIATKFDILDRVREMTKKSKVPITLSIGISSKKVGVCAKLEQAQSALDIAMARGGDQAAVHQEDKVIFLGGKTNAVEKRTRVRARMVSAAISNLVQESTWVLIMGHVHTDMDALGAAVGMCKFVKENGARPYIVVGDINPSIERMVALLEGHEHLSESLISAEEAQDLASEEGGLLILVDTHRPGLVVAPRLLKQINRVVVIDHHRRGEAFVQNAVLVYMEPYASSTCELVAELLQYQEGISEMDALEATALLAGIVVDTHNFSARAGSRTFEAASFLRRQGADLTMVQMLLKEDLAQYLKRAQLIKNTTIINEQIAVAVANNQESYDQVLIAQAADTLLQMQGIVASFVIAVRGDGKIAISARSYGEINVQLIMERLGGGGHLTNAACQLKNSTVHEVHEKLLAILNE
ncbi:MAG: hypothetical protein RLZ12_317 [Bacillota bacterium]|jgi:c-di-AMP phosphodiesterase-like protein